PSPDYVPGPEEPEQAPPSSDYVSGPEYPEYLASSNAELPVEDQPYAVDASPTSLSSGDIVVSDLEEDPKDESEDGPIHYPADGGCDDDSSGDGADDEEEEEHLAPADSTVVPPAVDPVPSAKKT
ncbi:hypothetical protein Tco_0342826, partial [Tanacetum coccineum]